MENVTSFNPDGVNTLHNFSNDHDEIARHSIAMIDEVEKDFKKFRDTNTEIDQINLRIIKGLLKRLHTAVSKINEMNSTDREHHYYIILNASNVILDICRMLRKANYYKLAARYLTFNILSLNHNLLLTTGKYLYWRVKNWIECAKAHADSRTFDQAISTLKKGIEQVDRLRIIEEQDPPILDADQQALESAYRLLRTVLIKYELQSGALTPEAWKKKVEEAFPQKQHQALCVVE